ncbi:MAG: 50S ribosomal protein L9 [Candidatus Omnitrophica bacterium CG23_combo_of_CG06-09_8_20_14_all_40_11]|nr:MAG: 50S ribosomal protein L9 [Candidatus Omnitrophica bacterium CG23_combo_of_CG06-09_8_20_14_all_40_11]
MEVILNQDIDRIGKAGYIVKVKNGFARNFLIPNGLAVPVTSANLKKLEQEKQQKTLQLEKVKREAEELKAKLARLSLTITVLVHEEDKLYANITSQDLAAALKEEGFNIDKNSIVLDEPIKSLGIYEVPVNLHPEILAKIKVWIVKK